MQIGSYTNLNHLWWDTIKTIAHQGTELGSRAGATKEILGFQATLTDPTNNILIGYPTRKFSLSYACAEVLWFLSGTSRIELIEAYAPSYKNYAEENKRAYGAYGWRWQGNPGFIKERTKLIWEHVPNIDNQLTSVIQLLKKKPNTRQAIMTMWDSGDLLHAIAGDKKDLPCTLTLKFFVREGRLHLIADMRSNDAWLGVPYDIFAFTTIQRLVAAECKLGLGTYTHQAGSMHLYERNFEKIEKIIERYWCETHSDHSLIVDNHKFALRDNICEALGFEQETRRTISSYNNFGEYLERGLYPIDNMFQDLVVGCATKWCDIDPQHFYNPLFQEWQRQNLGNEMTTEIFCKDCKFIELVGNRDTSRIEPRCKAAENLARIQMKPSGKKNWFEKELVKTGKLLSPKTKNKHNDCNWFVKFNPAMNPKRFGVDN